MRPTVNRCDLLKEMSPYKAKKVLSMARQKLVEDGYEFYRDSRNLEIPQEYIFKILGRYVANGQSA